MKKVFLFCPVFCFLFCFLFGSVSFSQTLEISPPVVETAPPEKIVEIKEPVAGPAAVPETPAKEEIKPAALPEKKAAGEPVETALGGTKLSGLLQIWYENDNGRSGKNDTFRMRRAEIKLAGKISKEISWAVMIDPAQVREDDVTTVKVSTGGNTTSANLKTAVSSAGRKSPLQDFLISMKHKYCTVDFGQYKTPFGMEGLTSSSKLDLIERAMLASKLKWADYRDVGFLVKTEHTINKMKIGYVIGLFNGEGQNKLDKNNPMDLAGRFTFGLSDMLHLGLAYFRGKDGPTPEADDNRTGLELKFTKDKLSVYGEYATGKTGGKNKNTYYATAVYSLLKKCGLVLRYDYFDQDTATANNAVTETSIGINCFLEKNNAKVQLNYVLRGEESVSLDNDVVRVNVQVAY